MIRVVSWTEAKYFSFIRSGLRRLWTKYPNKYKVLGAAKRKAKRKGRQKWEYLCASCTKWYKGKNVSVDHIIPCGSLKSFDDLPGFVSRLFCTEEELQVLCDDCHKDKTYADRGYSKEDQLVGEFKRLNAGQQRKVLATLALPDGSNAKARISIYSVFIREGV